MAFYSNPFVNNEVDRHGTNMAGLIASHPNNSICSVDAAYDVNLGIDSSTSGLEVYHCISEHPSLESKTNIIIITTISLKIWGFSI